MQIASQNTWIQKINKYFSTPYQRFSDLQMTLSLAAALKRVLGAVLGKKDLSVAFLGTELYSINEALYDLEFQLADPLKTFFGGDPLDVLHPYNPIEHLDQCTADLIFGSLQNAKQFCCSSLLYDLSLTFHAFKTALSSIKRRNLQTCLHPNKLAVLAVIASLCPAECNLIEVGAYQCGTTIFLAKLLQLLEKKGTIYALDTFAGMPAATSSDKSDQIYYDTGMFTDNQLEAVSTRIRKENVEDSIRLIKGNVCETLPKLLEEKKPFHFLFLDTDQYMGTKAGLDFAIETQPAFIIVDDTSCAGVKAAIREFLEKNPSFSHCNLLFNFDLIFNQKTISIIREK